MERKNKKKTTFNIADGYHKVIGGLIAITSSKQELKLILVSVIIITILQEQI